MRGKITAIVALLSVAGSAAGAEPPGPGGKVAAYYAKIEAKGDLTVATIEVKGDLTILPGFRFDPNPDLKSGQGTGAGVGFPKFMGRHLTRVCQQGAI
jgi:hypothetical protein